MCQIFFHACFSPQYLKDCDEVLVMQDGVVLEQGSYEDLITTDGEFASQVTMYNAESKKQEKVAEGKSDLENTDSNESDVTQEDDGHVNSVSTENKDENSVSEANCIHNAGKAH